MGREEEWKYIYILQEHICIEDTTLEMQSKAKGNTEWNLETFSLSV